MVEDIGTIISKGFATYTKNLNLCVPFVLGAVVISIIAIFALMGLVFLIFGDSLATLGPMNPEQELALFLQEINLHFSEIIILSIVFILIIALLISFFMGGAIGMTTEAMEKGKSNISTMINAGKKNILNLFLAYVLVGMIYFAGIIFIVPGAMKTNISQFLIQGVAGENPLFDAGILLWRIYDLISGLFLAVFSYAIVIDGLSPMEGINTSIKFFIRHKLDVLILSILSSIILVAYLDITSLILANHIILWGLLNFIIILLVIEPVITAWWVRLYLDRNDRKFFIDELLAHPNDLV